MRRFLFWLIFSVCLLCRGDLHVSRGSLVVSGRPQTCVRHHRRHAGAQDGDAPVHGGPVPRRSGVPLPKSELVIFYTHTRAHYRGGKQPSRETEGSNGKHGGVVRKLHWWDTARGEPRLRAHLHNWIFCSSENITHRRKGASSLLSFCCFIRCRVWDFNP